MRKHTNYNWGEIKETLRANRNDTDWTFTSMSDFLSIPISTLRDNIDLFDVNAVAQNKLFRVTVEIDKPDKVDHIRQEFVSSVMVIPDLHFGFVDDVEIHEPDILSQVIDIAGAMQPDRIILLGDLLDFAELTDRFIVRPSYINKTQRALIECSKFLARLRIAVPLAGLDIIEGNHDFRLPNILERHLNIIAGLRTVDQGEQPMSLRFLLGLDKLDIEFNGGWPNNIIEINSALIATHGDVASQSPGASGTKLLRRYGRSVVFGHTHRFEHISVPVWSDKSGRFLPAFAYSPGCLCKIDGTAPGGSPTQGWTQGIGIIYVDEFDGMTVHHMPFDPKARRFTIR